MQLKLLLRTIFLSLTLFFSFTAKAQFNCPDLVDNILNSHSPIDEIPLEAQLAYSQVTYTPLRTLKNRAVQDIEKTLREGRITRMQKLEIGINSPFLVTFEDGTQAIWKMHREVWFSNYRAEVLAYELDQLLGINLVPPTTERTIADQKGSIQLFVDSIEGVTPPRSELDKQHFFDFLIDQRDRHEWNYLVSPDSQRIYSIDNGNSFTGFGEIEITFFQRRAAIKRFLNTTEGKKVMRNMRAIDLDQLEEELVGYLGQADSDRLLWRIEILIDYF